MSRLWDTPGFWARSNADDLLTANPDRDIRELAAIISDKACREDADLAKDTIVELHKRAEAGVRFWPEVAELTTLETEVRARFTIDADALEEPSVFWWQKL